MSGPWTSYSLRPTEVPFDESGKALLDGGCYVQRPAGLNWATVGGLQLASVIAANDKAKFLGQFAARLDGAQSDILSYADADVVLYVTAGSGSVSISGHDFALNPRQGAHIRAGEAFQVTYRGDATLEFLVTVCPGESRLDVLEAMPVNFDTAFPDRTVADDPAQRQTMADRFYQVLVGEDIGSAEVTQFIGQIPQSKAAPHRHLYEEAILILSARGTMWTENLRADVQAGDLIFLPAEQEHSLQCIDAAGMELAGHFYPSGEPNINY